MGNSHRSNYYFGLHSLAVFHGLKGRDSRLLEMDQLQIDALLKEIKALRKDMRKIRQHLEGVRDDLVGFPALHIDDEADAAGIVFEGGIVEALFARGARRGSLRGVEGGREGGVVVIHGLGKGSWVSVVS